MKTTFLKPYLCVVLTLALALTIHSCEETGDNGNATDGSYMKVGNETFQLDKGAFSLSGPNTWEQDGVLVDHYYHDLVMYSDDITIIKSVYGYDSLLTGNGGMFGCMVHPFDSTTIVGEYTFGSWDWDGDDATHGMPVEVTPDTTIYFGDMTLGSTLSIAMDNDSVYTIAVDGFSKSWKDEDSTAIEIRYTGRLTNATMR